MTPIDQQLQAIEDAATRHYPDDATQRSECLVRLLTERLRTYHTLYVDNPKPMGFDDLRRAGFSASEISLGSQDPVRS